MTANAMMAGCPQTELVEIELADSVAIISLNRPDKRNAINDAIGKRLYNTPMNAGSILRALK